jgi:hypothetical protein
MKYRIHEAVCKGDLGEIQRALKEYDAHRWINAPCPTKDYFCPLHLACEKQDKDIVQILLKNGADVHQKLPVEACAEPNSPSDLEDVDDLYAPIHFAVDFSAGDCSLLDILLKYGADVNHPLLDGTTPLHLAIQANDKRMIPIVEHLIKKGANINCRHGTGFTTAIEDSYRCGFTEITAVLSNMCQYCGAKQAKTTPLQSCPCKRHNYCSEKCQADDYFHANICKYLANKKKPRFKIGQKVKCVMLADDRMTHILRDGRVVRHWYNQEDFKKYQYVPYQILLECGALVYAPTDTDEDILIHDEKEKKLRNLPQFQPLIKNYMMNMKSYRRRRKKIDHLNPIYIKPQQVAEDFSGGENKENDISKFFSYYGQK